MIIGLCGPKLSGKGTVATYLVEHHGGRAYSLSGILRSILERLTLPVSRENMIHLVVALRAHFGNDILARALVLKMTRDQPTLGIIDGIRYAEELQVFSQLPDFRLLYITAPTLARYERTRGRDEKVGEGAQTFEEFMKEELAVTELGILTLEQHAAAVIANDGTLDELYQAIDATLPKL